MSILVRTWEAQFLFQHFDKAKNIKATKLKLSTKTEEIFENYCMHFSFISGK